MRRLLVLFEPAEVLDVPPEVVLACPLVIQLMLLSLGVLEGVGSEDDLIAELDDGLAGDEDGKSAVVGVVDSQLVAVDLQMAARAAVHEHCRLRQCRSDRAIGQVLQEQYFCLL
jgi:hypothetical protein